MNIPQVYHLEGDVWLVPCIANYNQNEFQPLAIPISTGITEDSASKKQGWSDAEDDMLLKIVESKGTKVWSAIARELNSLMYAGTNIRQGRQCRERWYNHVDPNLKKGNWTSQEDIFILEQQRSIGNKWSEIAKGLTGRTENSVKNRWKSMIKKAIREHPQGSDVVSILIAEKKRGEFDMDESYDESEFENKDESDHIFNAYDLGSNPSSIMQQPQQTTVNSVRTKLSSMAFETSYNYHNSG